MTSAAIGLDLLFVVPAAVKFEVKATKCRAKAGSKAADAQPVAPVTPAQKQPVSQWLNLLQCSLFTGMDASNACTTDRIVWLRHNWLVAGYVAGLLPSLAMALGSCCQEHPVSQPCD